MDQRIDALICPRWTIPVEPEVSVHEGLCLAFHKGRILALLSRADALQRDTPDVIHERPDHVLLPGLVNAHTHAAMTLMRGYGEDMALERWLNEPYDPYYLRTKSFRIPFGLYRIFLNRMVPLLWLLSVVLLLHSWMQVYLLRVPVLEWLWA